MRRNVEGRGLCAHLWLLPADQARKDVPCSPEAPTGYVMHPGEGGAEGNPVPRVSRTTMEVMWGKLALVPWRGMPLLTSVSWALSLPLLRGALPGTLVL